MMALMFSSQSRPFYHSSSILGLAPINPQSYLAFANHHLAKAGKQISEEAFSYLYHRFDGITWYIQYVLNMLYTSFSDNDEFSEDDVRHCIDSILSQQRFAYESLLFQLSSRQKQLLTIIAKEGKVSSVLSQDFLHTYRLSASTMQGVVKALLDKDFITHDDGAYQLCDKFLECSLREKA